MEAPIFYLNGKPLEIVSKIKYLGCIISSDGYDNLDIARMVRSIYATGNVLIRKFYMCTTDVKVKLFNSYLTSFYGLTVWYNYSNDSFSKLSVAYKRIFRGFFNIPLINTSTTENMLNVCVKPLQILQRNLLFSFYNRLTKSDNDIISNILDNTLYFQSLFFKHYFKKLYLHDVQF